RHWRQAPAAFVAVFGGTGLTGREAVHQLLQRGEEVVVLARDPAKLLTPLGSCGKEAADKPFDDAKLKVVQGDVKSFADVSKVIGAGCKGVIVSLGGKSADVGETMLTDGTSNVISAMKEAGTKRIAVVTSIGTGDSENQAPFFFKVLMYTMMSKIFKDKNNQEALFQPGGPGSDLEFTVVRPGGLTVEPPTGVIHRGRPAGSIARADVADFCLGAVLEPGFPYLGRSFPASLPWAAPVGRRTARPRPAWGRRRPELARAARRGLGREKEEEERTRMSGVVPDLAPYSFGASCSCARRSCG
ncbi:unnamed protein product, partial [Prorocentrum cordatum]